MSNELNIGKLITTVQQRDAIHVAIAPVVAAEKLPPGAHVGLVEGGVGPSTNPIGIIDPYLNHYVDKGAKCWLFLYPNTVTSLRHEWTHPAFNPAPAATMSQSEAWLRQFALTANRSYECLLELAEDAIKNYGTHVGTDDDQDTFNDHKRQFLFHAAVVLGLEPPDPTDVYFSCSC